MISKHTPGPWESGSNPKADQFGSNGIVVRPTGEFPHGLWIADCGFAHDEKAIANARLIAAAPEMLNTLKDVRAYLFEKRSDPAYLRCIDIVLAKAEGKQPKENE